MSVSMVKPRREIDLDLGIEVWLMVNFLELVYFLAKIEHDLVLEGLKDTRFRSPQSWMRSMSLDRESY